MNLRFGLKSVDKCQHGEVSFSGRQQVCIAPPMSYTGQIYTGTIL